MKCFVLSGLVGWTCFATAGGYNQYTEWRWTPHVIADTNADNNVRNQVDLTVPIHGPWLTMPREDSITVTWITRIPCAGGIQVRDKGDGEWGDVMWPIKYGQVDYSKDLHSFNIVGLKPGTEYEYRLLSNMDHYRTPYHMVVSEGREVYSFKTVNPKRCEYRVWLTADTHGATRLTLDRQFSVSGAGDADFFFFLGDNLEDGPYSNIRYYITFGFLDDVVRLWGKRKPTVFLRGNHELNGVDTYQYGDYFQQPDGKTYQAFRQGGVLWISLDAMCASTEKIQNNQAKKYLIEQRDWFGKLKTSEAWKTAEFRVVMAHVVPYPGGGTAPLNEAFSDVLLDGSPEGRIHLYMSGHHHCYWRINPNCAESRCSVTAPADFKKLPSYVGRWKMPKCIPFVNVTFNTGATVSVDAAPGKLVFRNWDVRTGNGALYDAFELSPDGGVRDLVETSVLQVLQPK